MHQYIHDTHQRRHGCRDDQTAEDYMPLESESVDLLLEAPAPGPVAHQQELDSGTIVHEPWRYGQQVVVSLELEEAGDIANDDVLRREPEPGAKLEVVGRGKERSEREATDDVRELIRSPNAGGQVLLLHRLGHDDEVGGDSGGVTLRSTKQRGCDRPLKRAEGRPVDCVQ